MTVVGHRHQRTWPPALFGQMVAAAIFLVIGGWTILGSLGLVPFQKLLAAPWTGVFIGLTILVFGMLRVVNTVQVIRALLAKEDENQDWRTISPREGLGGILASWNGVLLTLLIPALFLEVADYDLHKLLSMHRLELIGLLLASLCVGLVLLGYSVHLTLGALLYGHVPLRLKTWPVRPGMRMEAELAFSRRPSFRALSATLSWFRVSGESTRQLKHDARLAKKGDPDSEAALRRGTFKLMGQSLMGQWRDKQPVRIEKRGADSVGTMAFEIPKYGGPTNWPGERSVPGEAGTGPGLSRWEIKVRGELLGVDFRRTYPVPVGVPLSEVPPDAEKLRAAILVARTELNRGATPAQLMAKLTGFGNSEKLILQALEEIVADKSFPFTASLECFLADRTHSVGGMTPARRKREKKVRG